MNQPIPRHILHALQTPFDLLVALTRHRLHQHTHRPRVLNAYVRAADTGEVGAGEEVRVSLLLENHLAGVLIHLVGAIGEAEERKREEGREIRVVH